MLMRSRNPEMTWRDHTRAPHSFSWLIIGWIIVCIGLLYLVTLSPVIAPIGSYIGLMLVTIAFTPKFIRGALNPWKTICYLMSLGAMIVIAWKVPLFNNIFVEIIKFLGF